MTKSAADVEQEVEASRGRLNRTAEALKQKITPGELLDEATHSLGNASQALLSKLTEQARQNPLPMAMIGLGAAWLLVNAGRKPPSQARATQRRYRHPDFDTGYGDTDPATSGSFRETAAGFADSAREKASDIRERGREAYERTSHAARESTRSVAEYSRRVQSRFTETVDQEPLLMAGMGALVGLAIGSALPASEAENRLMGRMRDRLMEEGERVAQQGLRQAEEVSREVYDAAKSELQREDEGLASSVEHAARAGANVVREKLSN